MPTDASIADVRLLTADGFLKWLTPKKAADLIDGVPCMHSPVSIRHAKLVNSLDRLIGLYADGHRLGSLYRELVAVRLSVRNVFLPDLAFFRTENPAQVLDTCIRGAPDLVVEVLSPTTADRDVGPKFAEYEEHGVTEYWIIDPVALSHRFFRRDGEILAEYAQTVPKIVSVVLPGFFLLRKWLDPDNLPSITEVFAAMEEQ